MVTKLVTDPHAFFGPKARRRGLWLEVVVVALSGALGSLGLVYVVQLFLSMADAAVYSTIQAVGFVATPVIGIFAYWLGAALLCHIIAGRFRSRGPMGRLLKLSAWALLPIGLGNLARSAALYFAYADVSPDGVAIGTGSFQEQMAAFTAQQAGDPALLLSSIVLVLTVAWSGYLLSVAVEAAKQGLSETEARKTAAVPTVIFVVVLLATHVGGLSVF